MRAGRVIAERRGRDRRRRHRRRRHGRRDRRQFRGAETIDAAGQVVLPGLINTHTHAPMVLYRGLADDLALMEWLDEVHLPGRGQDRVAGVRARRHAAGGARDDPVGHDDLRRHVLLRGGDREGDEGGRPARRARPDGHPVSGGRRQDAGRGARAGRGVHQRVQGRSADHAGRRAARDVHARRPDAEGGARPVAAPRRADADSSGRDARRGEDRAGPVQGVAGRLSRQSRVPRPRRLAAHGVWVSEPEIAVLRSAASACRTTPRAT